jgi:DNA-directed RNA polymerase subunit RPC12/RpoP
MAGKVCPGCGRQTFFEVPGGRRCTKCGTEMLVPVSSEGDVRGAKCPNCGKFQVFDDQCRNCGATFVIKKANSLSRKQVGQD